MSPTKTLKKIMFAIVFVFTWVSINGVYFEYCVSRDLIPSSLEMILAPIILAINIFAIVKTIKFLERNLNL